MQLKNPEGSFLWYKDLFSQVLKQIDNPQNQIDGYQLLVSLKDSYSFDYPDNKEIRDYALKISNYTKKMSEYMASQTGKYIYEDVKWNILKFEAPELFESYLHYMEKNRIPNRKFYEPRKKTLHTLVEDLQDLEDRKIKFLGVSLPPRTAKSTTCIFFLSWIMGKRPNSHSAMSGHSGILADGFYSEILNLLTTQEYTFGEIFPNAKLEKKSAEKKEINLDKPDRFSTLTCRGIDGTFTGQILRHVA